MLWALTEAGGDDKLIPSVVSNTIIPRLCAAVRTTWNPFSRAETRSLVASVRDVLDVEPDGDAIQVSLTNTLGCLAPCLHPPGAWLNLLAATSCSQSMAQAILTKLRVAVDDVCVPLFVRVDGGTPSLAPLSIRLYLRACKVSSP